MDLTRNQLAVLGSDGHLLVTGGPGSGKTTVSILKAARIAEQHLAPGQVVLFLSFARATVSRVVEAIEHEHEIPRALKRRIEVETYHSFFWRILKAHGYLVGLPRRLRLLPPPAEAIALSEIRAQFPTRKLTAEQKAGRRAALEKAVAEERARLALDGLVCFDLFAPYVANILQQSARIRKLVATRFPVIILDEFQDTNHEQWRAMEALGQCCTLFALADPEQRIYDFIGADPQRLDHFRQAFKPIDLDLSTDNHRSPGTDIALFGNHVLKGMFRPEPYIGVRISYFPPNENQAYSALVQEIYRARRRLVEAEVKNWSLAILVPTKSLARVVSDVLRRPPAGMSPVPHSAVVEIEGAILAAEVIAVLLQPAGGDEHFAQVVALLCDYCRGRNGVDPTQGGLKEGADLQKAYEVFRECQTAGRAMRRNSILAKTIAVYQRTQALTLTGEPDKDWRAVRKLLDEGECAKLQEVARDVRNLRVLDRGTELRQALSSDWRDNGAYRNALTATRRAFVQDHLSTNARPERGVVVMNMHKAKGKQFDEVIIFEGWPRKNRGQIVANNDRILRSNSADRIDDQARQNLRVSVTRGKRQTTILTPQTDPCRLLFS